MSSKKSLAAIKTVQDLREALPQVPYPEDGMGGIVNDAPDFEYKYCIVMVGLPARGKTLISGKLVRYLRWLSINAKNFNVGSYRRNATPHPTADFFDASNKEGEKLRREAAEAAISDMFNWLDNEDGTVAILDATNSTKARRKYIKDLCDKAGRKTLFIESCCDDESIILQNIYDVKTTSPDYKDMDPDDAVADFQKRINNYRKFYETIDSVEEKEYSYVQLINVGAQVVINRVDDYLLSRVVYFVRNLHIRPRTIYLSRHGESMFNLWGKIGGDADLSPRGQEYARKLPSLVMQHAGDAPIKVWTSTLKRTIQTAQHLPYPKKEWKALDELESGVCDSMTYEEIERIYPEDFKHRDDDKYHYRYRGGESYEDVVTRLEPIIMELEREEHILIVTHQAVIRCLYAYLMNTPQDRSPWMEIPLHTLIELTPGPYKTTERRFKGDIPAVSTFRQKYSSAKHQETDSPGAHEAGLYHH